jgi:hypothetical protein
MSKTVETKAAQSLLSDDDVRTIRKFLNKNRHSSAKLLTATDALALFHYFDQRVVLLNRRINKLEAKAKQPMDAGKVLREPVNSSDSEQQRIMALLEKYNLLKR